MGSAFTGNLSLSYERVLSSRFSLSLQGGYLLQRKLPDFVSDRIWKNNETSNQMITIGKPSFSGWSLTPEFRYYFLPKQEAPNGLYAALYLRNWNYGSKININFQESSGQINSNILGKINYFAVRPGLQIGYQALIAQRFSIDGFLGANYGYNGVRGWIGGDLVTDTYDVFMNKLIAEAQLQSAFTQEIVEKIKNTFASKVDHASFVTGFALPGVRAGITVGYAF